MVKYNLATCSGWITEQEGFGVANTGCISSRLMLVLLFFMVAFVKKWVLGDDEVFSLNMIWGLLFTFLPYIIIISLTGAMKWSFLASIIGGVAWIGLSMSGMLGQQ
jgi:hypothetical protein